MKLPLVYRPNEHDDWGIIRDASGQLVARSRHGRLLSEDEVQDFRNRKADPYEEIGQAIIKAVNSHEELVDLVKSWFDPGQEIGIFTRRAKAVLAKLEAS